jgi:hypothetical protein
MSDVASWLGNLTLRQGRLGEAEAYFLEQHEVLRVLVAEDPRNARWKEQRHDVLLLLADVQAQRGRLDEAHATVEAAAEIGAALATQDSSNNYWRLTGGREAAACGCTGFCRQPVSIARLPRGLVRPGNPIDSPTHQARQPGSSRHHARRRTR